MIEFVYFIQAPDGAIKIGSTICVARRLRSLSTSHSGELRLLGALVASRSLERSLHKEFAEDRIHLEWFKPTYRLLKRIGHLLATRGTSKFAPYSPRLRSDRSVVLEAQAMIKVLCEPWLPGDTSGSARKKLEPLLPGWASNRIKAVWYAYKDLSISATEIDLLRSLVRGHTVEDQSLVEQVARLSHRVQLLEEKIVALDRLSELLDRPLPDGASEKSSSLN